MKKYFLYNLELIHIVNNNPTDFGKIGIEITNQHSSFLKSQGFKHNPFTGHWTKERISIKFRPNNTPHRAPQSPQPHGYRSIAHKMDEHVVGERLVEHFRIY